jgi:hypothetical protein
MTIATKVLLEHALDGFATRRAEVEQRINEIRLRLRGSQAAVPPPKRRVLSPEGRARIIAATKRRWAKARRLKREVDVPEYGRSGRAGWPRAFVRGVRAAAAVIS